MAENNSTTKAERAVILIGDISINVYMLPDGSYRLAGRNVTDAVEEPPMSLSQVKSVTGESFIPVSIDDAVDYWFEMGCKGNAKAKAISKALMAESVERRADIAYGKLRSEDERNQRLKTRMDGKLARRTLTDAIADYIVHHPELSDNAKKWLYKNATDREYKILFAKTCKQLVEERGVESLRDSLKPLENIAILGIEDLASRFIDGDMEPMAAINEACVRTMAEGRFISAS